MRYKIAVENRHLSEKCLAEQALRWCRRTERPREYMGLLKGKESLKAA